MAILAPRFLPETVLCGSSLLMAAAVGRHGEGGEISGEITLMT